MHFHDFSASFLAKISSSETVAKRDAKYREVMTSQKTTFVKLWDRFALDPLVRNQTVIANWWGNISTVML